MLSPDHKTLNRSGDASHLNPEQQRLKMLATLGLLEAESVTVFEEAAQIAAHFLDATICVLGLVDLEREWFKSAVGLSRLGLMNDLAVTRQLARPDSLAASVVDARQVLMVGDLNSHPDYIHHLLSQRYGICAYLGVPLMTSSGHCIGALSVMELTPRTFTAKEIESLELIARWCMSEFERNHAQKQGSQRQGENGPSSPIAGSVKVNLIAQMTQELRTPLTSIMGMASVLMRQIYGPLTDKQKEYMDIVHHSGQYLLTLVNEILELGALDDSSLSLNLTPVDIEMLSQQAMSTLMEAAQRRSQQFRLTIEPGPRIWLLDKDKVRQMLYHLMFGIIQASSTDSTIRLHISRKQTRLNITLWTSHPWLGEGLPQMDILAEEGLNEFEEDPSFGLTLGVDRPSAGFTDSEDWQEANMAEPKTASGSAGDRPAKASSSRQSLGLALSRQLAEMHGGSITIQGSIEAGYRYVINLPQLSDGEASGTM